MQDWRGIHVSLGSHVIYAVSNGGGSISVKEGVVTEIGPDKETYYGKTVSYVKVVPVRTREKYSWETDRARKLTNTGNITVVPAVEEMP